MRGRHSAGFRLGRRPAGSVKKDGVDLVGGNIHFNLSESGLTMAART